MRERVLEVLRQVADGTLTAGDALDRIAFAPVESLSFATIDHHRQLRQGFPEVIYCPGKTVPQIVELAERISDRRAGFLATRAEPAVLDALATRFPEAAVNAVGRIVRLQGPELPPKGTGTVLIVTAGTSDLPVAEEAAETARAFGDTVARVTDVGVAGLHRVLGERDALLGARVVIVVAGMDGALPAVIAGLVRTPVIAVPTSVGYGVAFGGVAPLLTMLNSCASGVTVVNIDNGFGAAVAAARITHA